MDRRIIVEEKTVSRDSWNHPAESWSTLATVWAEKVDKSTSERGEMNQVVAINRTEWTIRYLATIKKDMRINYGGLYYYVTGVVEIGRKEGMRVITELRDNGN